MKKKQEEKIICGSPLSRGIAIGKPYFFTHTEDDIPERIILEKDVDFEIERYRHALSCSRNDVKRLRRELEEENALEAASILETHLQIMQDPLLTTLIENQIKLTRRSADYVFHHSHVKYQKKFQAIRDPFFRNRDKDLEDISRRLMSYLMESTRISLAEIPEGSIVFARELTATDTAEAKSGHVSAFVTECGGFNSHAAIVARAKGIPYVATVKLSELEEMKEGLVIVDGRTGEIILHPTIKTLSRYQQLEKKLKAHFQKLEKTSFLEAETFDGYKMRLSANLESAAEVDLLHQYKAAGVGLFRSEYIFLSKQSLPTEEEQFEIYKRIVERMEGLPIVIRTFDVGGDKVSLSQQHLRDVSPYLGLRAIRFLLNEPDIFKSQVRAILRAALFGKVSIMFPMVSGVPEIIEAKKIVNEVHHELSQKNLAPKKLPKIGCMIEVPSAVIIADLLAKECDFLSIGTNDLVQYSLAVDRTNEEVSAAYTPMHPSVLRMIKFVVTQAKHYGKPVTVCGEVAADPRFTPLLIGLGCHELSVASRHLPFVKNAIRKTSYLSAYQLAARVLTLTTSADIQELLMSEYQRTVPEDFYHNVDLKEVVVK